MFRGWLSLCLVICAMPAAAAQWEQRGDIATLFDLAGARGTFVVLDAASGRLSGHDEARARQRFVPASTFKIVNALIGLARGSVRDVEEILPWGGQPQPFPQWERDMSLREGFPISNVPVYQELARRTGLATLRRDVARLGYGNADIGTVVDRFWLDGPLAISAVEQAQFLARLASASLPYPVGAQRSVRNIALIESGDGWALYGKTGWANPGQAGIGWWVGWVECGRRIHAFALNMDMQSVEDAPLRLSLGRAGLQAVGVLPCAS